MAQSYQSYDEPTQKQTLDSVLEFWGFGLGCCVKKVSSISFKIIHRPPNLQFVEFQAYEIPGSFERLFGATTNWHLCPRVVTSWQDKILTELDETGWDLILCTYQYFPSEGSGGRVGGGESGGHTLGIRQPKQSLPSGIWQTTLAQGRDLRCIS